MKNIVTLFLLISMGSAYAQESEQLYNPELDGMDQIETAVKQAAVLNKHVFIQAGGNWCGWCKLFNKFINEDEELKSFVDSSYITIHLNWSRENENSEAMASLGYPQRFGFPVFIILDSKGKRIHTQDSALLEEGHGYNRKKVMSFFKNWTTTAIDPKSYEKK